MIVKAIDGMRQQPDYFKDYIFPIVSAFFSSLLGAGAAYLTLRHQDGLQIEKDKLVASNKWILKADQALQELVAIKKNYHGVLTQMPIQRLLSIPSILLYAKPMVGDYQDLSFIAPKGGGDYHEWSQIPRIRAMFSNYNYVLSLWRERNELNQRMKEKLLAEYGDDMHRGISKEQILKAVGKPDLQVIIDLSEKLIRLTDDVICELNAFLVGFPEYLKSVIQTTRLKRFGTILLFSANENPALMELMKKSPKVDFTTVEDIFDRTAEDIMKRHETGYEE